MNEKIYIFWEFMLHGLVYTYRRFDRFKCYYLWGLTFLLGLFDCEDESIMVLRNVGNY